MRQAILCAAIAAAAMSCGGAKVAPTHVDLAKYMPATLDAHHAKSGEPRPLHVRAWADAGVRATPTWRDDLSEQLDYASQLLVPLCGIRLVLDATKEWDRSGEPREALAALAKLDPGDDVAWVIGYIAANDTAATAMADLGDAHLLGKHVIVHAWATTAEERALMPTLPALTDAERAEIFAAHRRHKQTVVLLHFLGISLGAIDAAEPTLIEHPSYAPTQTGFADRNRDLVQITADDLVGGGGPTQTAPKLLALVDANWGGWVPAAHDDALARLRQFADAAKGSDAGGDVPATASAQLDHVKELAAAGNLKEARIALDTLLAAYPANATIHEQRCELLLAQPNGVKDPVTRAACARVSELAPGNPAPHLAVGEALAKAGELAAAHVELTAAAAAIANLPTVGEASAAWQKVVAIYTGLGALTWTEDAIAQAKLPRDVAGPMIATIAQTRVRYGVPRGATFVTPADEAALVAAERAAIGAADNNKFADAERALAAADKRWHGAAGLFTARCDLAIRQTAIDAARAACGRALAIDPDQSYALYLRGIVALRDTGAAATNNGMIDLRKAIAIDPELGQAWRALGKALARDHDKPGFDKLAAEYQTKFGTALAP